MSSVLSNTKVPGHVYRSLFAFDPERHAIILSGGDKKGKNQEKFYKRLIAQAEIHLKSKDKIATIRLQQVRKYHHVTQKKLAKIMGLSQSALSDLERRPNITINAMQRYVEALGGHLEIKAVFQEGSKKLLA